MSGKPVLRGLVAGLGAGWCGTLALAAGAAAAPAWLPAQNVRDPVTGPEHVITNVQLAGDPAGNTIAVWERLDPKGDANPANDVILIETAFRPAGGSFGSPQVISGNELTSPPRSAVSPDVGMDALGRALVVWGYDNGANEVIQARVRNRDGTFGAISDLSALEPGNDAARPQVAVNAGGHAAVVWERLLPDLVYGTTGSIDGGFAPASVLSAPPGDIAGATVAVDGAGNALFAWQRDPPLRRLVEARPKPVSGGFGDVAPLSPDQAHKFAELPQVAFDAAGRATIVWSFEDDDANNNGDPGDDADTQVIRFATRSAPPDWADGSFDQASTIQAAGSTPDPLPDVAVDAQNTAVVTWIAEVGGDDVVLSASRPSDGSFGNLQTLSSAAMSPHGVTVTIGTTGDAMAAWHGTAGSNAVVQATRRLAGAGSSFGAVDEDVELLVPAQGGSAGFASGPELAGDDQGNVIGAWSALVCDPQSCRYTPRFAAFDAAPPTFTSVTVPGAATTGQAVGMSASAFDRIGGPSLGWGFGDGGGATGGSVSHAFGAPGAYNVTVTATDGVGNAASQTVPVQVTSAPPPPPPPPPPPAGPRTVSGRVVFAAKSTRRHTTVTRFAVQNVTRGGRVRVSCRARRGCPFRQRAFAPRRGSANLLRPFRGRRLRPGAVLEVRITAPGMIGKVVRLEARRARAPRRTALCLPPGSRRPERC